ncbi:uncharacterized protein OCT59_018934 [Rhizophagus irregularis]|uniref:Uncharacterized protein n=1 Tax=Rhizophagus irregularis (strain DAOM 181602 / DAOM 197198 / MUCL 43194) TaxID=747089 RepID=A0A2P4PUP8_RHIID|nr:hypothetical protein GLOIN_2v1777457 [Rhizophagus irregularis DAOM 181602=DAOM 197198]POG69115.1 hypothetical protein GLOIN_2v1777457 [Rhizophagus irregularis DAOM 181602=DAOM 197198]UZO26720.1 hypothetical protein OCT59_018934 [Rhizophagus irregularis]GET62586.1 hypothetical protein GLOIN_2v1777457 [Rhizophagus irregularis DAOM 181602=DAOM 197198]|eukprot:XP_025175981.1 hypothetical protein GLOIN_2v1777457 [Rhizophagus irregularis DAOM 181602=DAOM 197198]
MSELLIEELFNHVQNCLVENKKTQRKREEKRRQREEDLKERDDLSSEDILGLLVSFDELLIEEKFNHTQDYLIKNKRRPKENRREPKN